jgi:hypothetical protein
MICTEDQLNKIYKLESPVTTLKVLIGLYAGSIVTGTICHFILVWISVNLLFALPLVYKLQKDKIDQIYSQVTSLITKTLSQVESKIPRYRD